ncbi:unnamed protein product [Sphagnum tenellum]
MVEHHSIRILLYLTFGDHRASRPCNSARMHKLATEIEMRRGQAGQRRMPKRRFALATVQSTRDCLHHSSYGLVFPIHRRKYVRVQASKLNCVPG